MPVTNVTITQSNVAGQINLLAVSSPLIFIIEVEYTLAKPDLLYVNVKDEDSNILGTFKCIEYIYEDASGKITYRFVASDVLDAFMYSIDDVKTPEYFLQYVENITKQFTLEFVASPITSSVTFQAIRAAAQFGETPSLDKIYNNEDLVFYGSIDEPVYVYFYNNNESNNLSIDVPYGTDDAYLDYDDTPFLDNDGSVFRGI